MQNYLSGLMDSTGSSIGKDPAPAPMPLARCTAGAPGRPCSPPTRSRRHGIASSGWDGSTEYRIPTDMPENVTVRSLFAREIGAECLANGSGRAGRRLAVFQPPDQGSSGDGILGSSKLSMVSLRQESLGKEEETRTRKPFVGTLRVRIPPGRAGPAARSESCVVVGRPTLRGVDSEVKGRVIEPRKYQDAGSLRPGHRRGPCQATHSWSTQPAWSYRGRRARTMTIRVLQEPERPRRLHRKSGRGDRNHDLLAPGGTPTTEGSEPRAKRWYRLVKNRNESRRTAGSRSVP